MVVGSIKELEELSGKKIEEPHIPWIDDIKIQKDNKTYKRVQDVLDVWVDAGTLLRRLAGSRDLPSCAR